MKIRLTVRVLKVRALGVAWLVGGGPGICQTRFMIRCPSTQKCCGEASSRLIKFSWFKFRYSLAGLGCPFPDVLECHMRGLLLSIVAVD